MPNLADTASQEETRAASWSIPLFVLALVMVANSALVLGLLQILSWEQCVVVVGTGVALSGGILFTAVKMQSLGKGR
jgi:hypothetical protein